MTPHLGRHVRAYVDRALPVPMLKAFDKHLVCCTSCRALADQERRIVASLRADTGVPQRLRSSLMGLALEAQAAPVPDVPRPPLGFRMPPAALPQPVPTVPPASPALHRSPVRAALVASVAAGASVAAAWGLAVSPLPSNNPLRVPAARVPAGAATVAPASLSPASLSPALIGPRRSWGSGTADPRAQSAGQGIPVVLRTPVMQGVPIFHGGSQRYVATDPVRLGGLGSAESRP